jgi:hypothetical protein
MTFRGADVNDSTEQKAKRDVPDVTFVPGILRTIVPEIE